ncbi:unnamed protein product [Trichobilharzia regenti]|nr:unnamed protein product [Trichobilharzia regenti]
MSSPSGSQDFSSLDSRERQRQRSVNQAFAALRCVLPTHPPDKKLSKHEILRLSIKYIRILEAILKYQEEVEGHSSISSNGSHSVTFSASSSSSSFSSCSLSSSFNKNKPSNTPHKRTS